MKKTKWLNFLNDIGDTVGGFLVGIGFCSQQLIPTIIGLMLIVTSISIEYFGKGKKDSN